MVLAGTWQPLGPIRPVGNIVFAVSVLGGSLLFFQLFLRAYEPILRWCLRHKVLFLSMPALLILLGVVIWFGFARVFAFVPPTVSAVSFRTMSETDVRTSPAWNKFTHAFPGLGKEFMPPLD